ncbi:BamA/TamA family outer membrane protein [Spirosoma aerolatum]|uniref:BamA/TamA family outer membrane protein n=1 Tax=Spirosoma aerolatum TaxID=1211326 RepID=UPI0009ADD897|nr:BamA/TamA family outer membrane protein [Spirosoma aerolatum]
MKRVQKAGYGLVGLLCLCSSVISTYAQVKTAPAGDSIRQRVILIGDAGRLRNGKNPVVDAVSSRYDLNDSRTTLLYLGDNVYTYGLPEKGSPGYDSLVAVLAYQARPGLARPGLGKAGKVLFIPGNHDWSKGRPDGWERIKRQGEWLDSLQAPNIRMVPSGGCPGPEEIPLGANLVLVVVDTQWWLHPYTKPGVESDCACKSEDEVLARLSDIAYRNKGKGIILATHHPMRSYGIHGGYYTLKQHIFPLTEFSSGLYIPLPVIGSIYPLVRGVFGNIQDLSNPSYQLMVKAFERAMAPAPNVVFVAGHDHALQHIVDGARNYIVSGSGINRERVKRGKLAQFVSSDWGYVVLDLLANGKLNATFYTVDEQAKANEAHTATLFTVPTKVDTVTANGQRPNWPDSVQVAIAPEYERVGRVHRWLLGTNYRTEWASTVKLPVFDIRRTMGGFKILQRGGGFQTKSLRIEDSSGREWVLRSIQKDPAKALPRVLQQTIAKDVLQDEISAGYPFAPLAVPILAQAAGVPHANPRVVYLPDDPALGIYQADFGNSVYLFEERSPGDNKSVSTPKVLDALEKDNDNRVDEKAVLRARMLDLFMGDWDRHEDQWRWGSRKQDKGKLYYPIPRDRDQVFFRANGLLPTIGSLPWIQPKFQGFTARLPNVNGFMFNGRYFDRLFLHGLTEQDWTVELKKLHDALTDGVLEQAIRQLPEASQKKNGQKLLETLKIRREWLLKEGLTYYRFLAKAVDIPGSDKAELFRIEHLPDNKLTVSVFKITRNGVDDSPLYRREFDGRVTDEVRLYGRKGDDRFEVVGTQPAHIRVRLIGGKGEDVFTVAGQPGKPRIYDARTEANVLPEAGKLVDRRSTDKTVNQYDPHAFKYDRVAPLATIGFNPDDGLILGAGVQWIKQGFRKTPYAAMNRLMITRSLATEAMSIKYDGMFTDLIGKNDLWLSAFSKAPDNVTNFFGPGNETVYDKSHSIRYYRTRYDLINVAALLKPETGNHMELSVGPVFQHFSLNRGDNGGRFIEKYLADLLPQERFLQQESYVGLQAGLLINNRNNPVQPSRGLHWNTTILALQGFDEQSNNLLQFRTDLSVYTSFSPAARLVISNRIGGGLTYGNPAFYQLLYLGGQDNLRGFRTYRFAGNHLIYHNIEARLKLFSFRSFLFPASVGLLAFNDVGRVWLNGESSHRWHDGYGAGLYMNPAQLLTITASIGFSDESTLPYVSLGFRF